MAVQDIWPHLSNCGAYSNNFNNTSLVNGSFSKVGEVYIATSTYSSNYVRWRLCFRPIDGYVLGTSLTISGGYINESGNPVSGTDFNEIIQIHYIQPSADLIDFTRNNGFLNGVHDQVDFYRIGDQVRTVSLPADEGFIISFRGYYNTQRPRIYYFNADLAADVPFARWRNYIRSAERTE